MQILVVAAERARKPAVKMKDKIFGVKHGVTNEVVPARGVSVQIWNRNRRVMLLGELIVDMGTGV